MTARDRARLQIGEYALQALEADGLAVVDAKRISQLEKVASAAKNWVNSEIVGLTDAEWLKCEIDELEMMSE